MKLSIESDNKADYLKEIPGIITFNTLYIQERIKEIESQTGDLKERAKIAFELARDEIKHSFDTKELAVTINGEEALRTKNGICFAKSHTLATLLRGMHIPTGFCYQRVLRDGKTVESGYALHGLNALYFEDSGWFRVDPRGNKAGIDAQFTWEKEQLAYPIRTALGEVDYPQVFVAPLQTVIYAMEESKDSIELFSNRPEFI